MKQFKFIFIGFMLFALACSDSKENDDGLNGGVANNVEAEKQIKEALAALDKEEDLSTFTEALKGIDAKTLEGKEFTLLAYKNKPVESEVSASVAKAETTTPTDANVLRHMISGNYTLEELKKEKKLLALSKDTLYIENLNNELTVNGVKLGKSIVIDNSIIFVMDSIIPVMKAPVEEEKDQYEFTVYNINAKWSAGQEIHEGTAGGVNVDIYEISDTLTLVESVTADANGKVNFTYRLDAALYYSISNGNSHSTFDGYRVTGLFTTQDEVDNPLLPVYKSFKKEIGGLMIEDLNGDGLITEADKVEVPPLSAHITEVYLVPESFKVNNGTADISLEDVYNAYDVAENTYYVIDNVYSTLAKRKTINKSDSLATAYWKESYAAIGLINGYIEKETNNDVLLELREKRADIYASLATLFGRVPLQTEYPLELQVPQSTQKEVQDFALQHLNEVVANLPDTAKSAVYLKLALLHRDRYDYNESFATLKKALVVNEVLSGNPSKTTKMVYLLAGEMVIEVSSGINLADAIGYVNTLYAAQGMTLPLFEGATEKEILAVVKRDLKQLDSGIKFMNAKQWEDMAAWGHYALLPIPAEVMTNTKLTQNAGW